MIKSMTAYARSQIRDPQGQEWIWEIRSVNHRYLEQSYRLPDSLKSHEYACRELVNSKLSRGKIDLTLKPILKSTQDSEQQAKFTLNTPLLNRLINTGNQLAAEYQSAPLTTADILRWPGILDTPEADQDDFQRQSEWMTQGLDAALMDFIQTRESEGAKIKEMITARCDQIDAHIDTLYPLRETLIEQKRDKLRERIDELQVELDPDRLEQEIALLAQKLDVSEELDRLRAHASEIREILDRDDAIGRRLDFMMQELNREANTLSSKSHDQTTTQIAIDLKVLIEQMREQIQNIE